MKIQLERREIHFILNLLAGKPMKEVAPLVEKIANQLVTDCTECANTEICKAGHYGAYLCEPRFSQRL
jgi:hypothetical protein